jgi:cytochrome c oxidase subunit II
MILANAQNALAPAGPQAQSIGSLWWMFHWIFWAIWIAVVVCMFIAIFKNRTPQDHPLQPEVKPDPAGEKRVGVVISILTGITVVILFVLLISDFVVGRKLFAMSKEDNQREIKITGQQWFWTAEYEDATASNIFTTANEFHIPVGVPIKFYLTSTDVIHSFWVPELHGKKDLIPGHDTQIWLKADKPGRYDGQCAEFCGHQHAKMRFAIIAEDADTFKKWCETQRAPARQPTTNEQIRGQQVFLNTTCITCHTIGGTKAGGRVGPPLTHVGGNQTIAANSVPNDEEHLREWINNPHQFKPGVRMPMNNLPDEDLKALAAYLHSLE